MNKYEEFEEEYFYSCDRCGKIDCGEVCKNCGDGRPLKFSKGKYLFGFKNLPLSEEEVKHLENYIPEIFARFSKNTWTLKDWPKRAFYGRHENIDRYELFEKSEKKLELV